MKEKQEAIANEASKKAAEENEAVRRQKELIQMQQHAQQQILENAKAAAAVTQATAANDLASKFNVLDIKVEEDVNFDDI